MKPIFPEGTKIVQDADGKWHLEPKSPYTIREPKSELPDPFGPGPFSLPPGTTVKFKEIEPGIHKWVFSPPNPE